MSIEAAAAASPAQPCATASTWTPVSPRLRAPAAALGRTPSSATMYAARAGRAPASTGTTPAQRPRTPEVAIIPRMSSIRLVCPDELTACARVLMTLSGCSVAVRQV
eukprot:scaffold85789_cov63-Phaeocystis_antarctica.AAC.3